MGCTAQQNKVLVEQFFEALNRGDTRALVDAYAEDGYVQTMGHTLISGRHDKPKIAAACHAIFDNFPTGLCFDIHGMIAEGDRVAVEASSDGLHASGRRYQNEYHFLFIFRDGKVVALKEYMDTERVTEVLCGGQRPRA